MKIAPMRIKVLLAAAALVVAPLGVAAPAHADEADDAFINTLDSNNLPYKSRDDAIRMANRVCTLLGNSPGEQNIARAAAYLAKNTTLSEQQMNDFGMAAIQAYCPERVPS